MSRIMGLMRWVRRGEASFSRGTAARNQLFDNRRVLEKYCQDDVTVLRQSCRVFRREFMHIGNTEVFLESITIASACNKLLRKCFLQPDNTGLIPTGGYT